jgi:hypothetical protein
MMASSKIIGRAACPWCEFDAAHVRESAKCLYLYCPDCGTSTHFRTPRQRDLLQRHGIRAEGEAKPAIEPAPVAPVAASEPQSPPTIADPIIVPPAPAKPKREPRKKAPASPPPAPPPLEVPPAPAKPPPPAPASWWGVAQ